MAPSRNQPRNKPYQYPTCSVLPFCCPVPGIPVELSSSVSANRKLLAMDYTRRHIDETLHSDGHNRVSGRSRYNQQTAYQETLGTYYQQQQHQQYQQPQQQTHRMIRQRSASELTEGRNSIVSPVSPLSRASTESSYRPTRQRQPQLAVPQSLRPGWIQQESQGVAWSLQTPILGSAAWSPQQTRGNSWSPQLFPPLNPDEARDKPLPPLPSLGFSNRQDDSSSTFESPPVQQRPRRVIQNQASVWTNPEILILPQETRLEDPQRIQNLSQLQDAMMTVDGLDAGGLGLGEPHRGPRGVGWAISRSDFNTDLGPEAGRPPPPYVASQWDSLHQWDDMRMRRCSSAH